MADEDDHPSLGIWEIEDISTRVIHLEDILVKRTLLFWGIIIWLVFVTTMSSFVAFNSFSNSRVVNAIQEQQNQQQVQQQESARSFNTFLQAFVNEQNYICQTLYEQAHAQGLAIPDPSTCKVHYP